MRYLIPFLAIVTSAVALAQQPPSASQSTQMSAPYTPVVPAPSISGYRGILRWIRRRGWYRGRVVHEGNGRRDQCSGQLQPRDLGGGRTT